MEGELATFVKIWVIAIISTSYTYALSGYPKGLPRLLLVLPVIVLFTVLPFSVTSIHFNTIAFFYITWLGNLKLILFCFGLGPLSRPLPLAHFVVIALVPIKVKESPTSSSGRWVGMVGTWGSVAKWVRKVVVFLCAVVGIVQYKDRLSETAIHVLYILHVCLGIEILFAVSAVPFQALLGLELEPQFVEPYYSSSLQDFWGSRWNLATSNILRYAIYDPIRRAISPLVGRQWGAITAVIASFTISGLVHELMFYQLTRAAPTWEVTCFFILHGFCTVAEVVVKKAFSSIWKPPRVLSNAGTSWFIGVTMWWLFMPQLLRNKVGERMNDEYFMAINFATSKLETVWRSIWH